MLLSLAVLLFSCSALTLSAALPVAEPQYTDPASSKFKPGDTSKTDKLAAQALANLKKWEAAHPNPNKNCDLKTGKNVRIRKEYSTLSNKERIAFSNSILCLMQKPPLLSTNTIQSKSRYDDLTITHINQTEQVYATGYFFSWHRYHTLAYENALRNECGYTGPFPYWNWGRDAQDILNAPIMDGSDTSLSGNGRKKDYNGTIGTIPPGLTPPPHGNGGGCLHNGPFKDTVCSFQSVRLLQPGDNRFAYRPHCITRDISVWSAKNNLNDASVNEVLTNYPDIVSFQDRLQGNFSANYYGPHLGGHVVFGGNPGGDFYSSPGDPVFYVHHAAVDRAWWIWQNTGGDERRTAVGGTITQFNNPPSRDVTLDDKLDLGVNGGPVAQRDLMSTTGGGPLDLCYIYE